MTARVTGSLLVCETQPHASAKLQIMGRIGTWIDKTWNTKSENVKGLLYYECQQQSRVPMNHFPWNLNPIPTPSTLWRNSQQDPMFVDVDDVWRSYVGAVTYGLTLGRYGFALQDMTVFINEQCSNSKTLIKEKQLCQLAQSAIMGMILRDKGVKLKSGNGMRRILGTCRNGVAVTLAYFLLVNDYFGVS